MKTGIEIISDERIRQIEKEGWSSEHDDRHKNEELAEAAASYALPCRWRSFGRIPLTWPFHSCWWKPSPDNRIRELAKAGALIAAEIDRLLREQRKEEK